MSDTIDGVPEFASAFPPHARMAELIFDAEQANLAITLEDDEAWRIPAESVAGLFGGRILRESVRPAVTPRGPQAVVRAAANVAIPLIAGLPVQLPKPKKGPTEQRSEELHYVLALRITDIAETWYLLASSFNFRKSLGPEAGYAAEPNLRTFVDKLTAFCPAARRDPFFAAMEQRIPLPSPVDSLFEFLRTVAAGSALS